MNKRRTDACCPAGALLAAPALADGGCRRRRLERARSEPSQALLAGQKDRWDSLPPERQRAMAEGAKRWLEMDGIGRAQANERWQHWRSLTPEQRERLRKGWQRFRELTPETAGGAAPGLPALQGRCRPSGAMPCASAGEQMSPEERRRAISAPAGREARLGGQAALPALLRTRIRGATPWDDIPDDAERTAQALA